MLKVFLVVLAVALIFSSCSKGECKSCFIEFHVANTILEKDQHGVKCGDEVESFLSQGCSIYMGACENKCE